MLGENTNVFRIGATKYNCFDSGFSRLEYVNLIRSALMNDERFKDMTLNDLIACDKNCKGLFPNLQKLVDAYPVPHDNMGFYMNNPDTAQNKLKMRYAALGMLKAAPKPGAVTGGAAVGGAAVGGASGGAAGGSFTFGAARQ